MTTTTTPSGGNDTASTDSGGGGPIKVAYLSDCEGAFGAFFEPDIAGANLAFIQYAGAQGRR